MSLNLSSLFPMERVQYGESTFKAGIFYPFFFLIQALVL